MILTANVQHLARIYLTDPLINGKGNLIEKSSVELQEEIILFHVYESLYAGGYVGHSISKPKGQEEGGGKMTWSGDYHQRKTQSVYIGRISTGEINVISYVNQIAFKFRHEMVIRQDNFIVKNCPNSKVWKWIKKLSSECCLELAYFVFHYKKQRWNVRAACFLSCFLLTCDVTTN